MQQLDLLAWTPPRKVIPFPTGKRIGHARKVAEQLANARTNREADLALTRACRSLRAQMRAAGIPEEEIERQHEAFLLAINAECDRIRAKWMPALPEHCPRHTSGGGPSGGAA